MFDKHLKKAGGRIGRNVGEITIKMKTIVRKPLMINFFLCCCFFRRFFFFFFFLHAVVLDTNDFRIDPFYS